MEANVLVRLMWVPLLRLTGTVVLTPAARAPALLVLPDDGIPAHRELPKGNLADARAVLRQATAALEKSDRTSGS